LSKTSREVAVKDRIIVIIALLTFAVMTHPQRRGYRGPAGARRWSPLTSRRRRLTAAGTVV
jgi:hypothetical protein